MSKILKQMQAVNKKNFPTNLQIITKNQTQPNIT